jgi:hypothetical protein
MSDFLDAQRYWREDGHWFGLLAEAAAEREANPRCPTCRTDLLMNNCWCNRPPAQEKPVYVGLDVGKEPAVHVESGRQFGKTKRRTMTARPLSIDDV